MVSTGRMRSATHAASPEAAHTQRKAHVRFAEPIGGRPYGLGYYGSLAEPSRVCMDRDMNVVGPAGGPGIQLADGETVVMDSLALHVVGFVAGVTHSGHLYLTTSRLVFRAHRVNLFGRSCALAVADVTQLLEYPFHPTDLIVVLPIR
jgi:hypothetical protein